MAGLCAAARARELGAQPIVYEKGTRAGGSMLLSSGFVWRFRSVDIHLKECPRADESLVHAIVEQFDDALDWLESIGVELLTRETGNPLTTGARFDPKQLVETLVRDLRLGETATEPTILATGGFAARFARERGLMLRANPWSEGDGLDFAVARGATTTDGMDEFYGRVMPAPPARIREEDFVPLAQLYGREARVFTDDWREITPPVVAWHENDLAQLIGPRAWYVVAETNERIEAARAAGGTVRLREDGALAVHVAAAVTHTIGGLQVDKQARVSGVEGIWAAGVDAGGVATGGYASGLAQALVLGLAAAESVAAG
jgi:succinate dehydrogenase/fumarate reductase flavoprotein subunit